MSNAAPDTANFHHETSSSVTTSFTTVTGNTVASGDNLLLAWIYAYTGNPTVVGFSSVAWNSHAMTFVGREYNTSGGETLELWALANPTAGTGAITATYPVALQGYSYAAALPVSNANLSGGLSSALGSVSGTFNATGSPISATAAGASNTGFSFGCAQLNTNTITQTNANGTNLGAIANFSQSSDYIPGIDPGAFTWTGTGGNDTAGTAAAVAVFGSNATNTTITPSVGSLTAAGAAPSFVGGVLITPGTA